MKLLVLLALLPTLGSSCATGYDVWFDGRCFREAFISATYYTNSYNLCLNDGSLLPSIKSKQENENVAISMSNQFGYAFWLGLTCNGVKFIWADGSTASYTNFAGDYKCSTSAIDHRYYYGNDLLWYEWKTGDATEVNNLVCEAKARSASPCDYFDPAPNDGWIDTCYQLQDKMSTWQAAEDICQQQNAHLAVIYDQKLNDFIRNAALAANFASGVHIGIQKDSSGSLSWVDGSTVGYTNFRTGVPDFGDCTYMDSIGLWASMGCRDTPLQFVCTKPAFYAIHTQPLGCPAKTTYTTGEKFNETNVRNTGRRLFISHILSSICELKKQPPAYSPLYPQAPGVSTCDYVLTSAKPNIQVEVEISFFESNTCCDTLTAYDGPAGPRIITTMSGYHPKPALIIGSSNTIRLRWEATSGAHVRGFSATVLS